MRQLPWRFGEFGFSPGSCRSIIFAPRSSRAAREKGLGWISQPQNITAQEFGSRSSSLFTLTGWIRGPAAVSSLKYSDSQPISLPDTRNWLNLGSVNFCLQSTVFGALWGALGMMALSPHPLPRLGLLLQVEGLLTMP